MTSTGTPAGALMTPEDWNAPFARAVTIAMSGATGEHAAPDDPFLIMLNAWWESLDFAIPAPLTDRGWHVEVDTADPNAVGRTIEPSAPVSLIGRSLMLLRGTQPAR
jgi:isoamylase